MPRLLPGRLTLAAAMAAVLAPAAAPAPAHACGSKFMPTQDCCTCVYSLLNKECDIPDCSICYDLPCTFPGAHGGAAAASPAAGAAAMAFCPSAPPSAASPAGAGTWQVAVVALKART